MLEIGVFVPITTLETEHFSKNLRAKLLRNKSVDYVGLIRACLRSFIDPTIIYDRKIAFTGFYSMFARL